MNGLNNDFLVCKFSCLRYKAFMMLDAIERSIDMMENLKYLKMKE